MADKKLRYIVLTVVGMLTFQTVDVFFIKSDSSFLGVNIFARAASAVIMIVVCAVLKVNIKRFCFKSYGWFFEAAYGALFSLVPFALCFFGSKIAFMIKGYKQISFGFVPPNVPAESGMNEKLLGFAVFACTLLLDTVFREMVYRGFLITQLADRLSFTGANIVQSAVYAVSIVPMLIKFWINGSFEYIGFKMAVFVAVFYLANSFCTGMKWGYFYRSSGTIWMAVSDHFLNNLVLNCFFVSGGAIPEKWYAVQVFIIQVISCMMFLPLYLRRSRVNAAIAEEIELSKEMMKITPDDYCPSIQERLSEILSESDSEILPGTIKNELEVAADFDRSQMPDQNKTAMLMDNFELDERNLFLPNEAESVEASPTEITRKYFNSVIERDDDKDKNAKEKSDNSDNISKIMQNYFEENFNKHTFGG